jgi:carboxyl-terminal processing protease
VIFLRRGALTLGVLLLVVAMFAAGVYADQNYPEYIPSLQVGPLGGQADRGTTDQALRVIEAHYYDSRVDSGKLSSSGVKAMVQSLGDPYSQYLAPSEFQQQQDQYAARHEGMIGIVVDFGSGFPMISGVLPNSPALKAGLETDDVIVRINGVDTQGIGQDRASSLIRGPAGSSVTLRVRRPDGDHDVDVTRANFQSPTVQSLRLEHDLLYIRIYQFGDATQREFDSQLRAGLPGAKGVILDLRNNGGGFVDAATAVVSRFVAGGEAFEQHGRGGVVDRTNVDGNHPAASVPLVVLVNGSSASASEIVAGAMQARGRARLVGVRTYGKGSVQVDYQLSNGGDLHLTVAHWFLPNGRSIDKQGLTPDVPVTLDQGRDMFDVVQPARGHAADAQLNRAVELLGGQ